MLALEGRKVPYVPWHCEFTVEAADKLRKHFGRDDLHQLLDNHFIKLADDTGFFTDLGNDRFRDIFAVVWNRNLDKDIGNPENCVLPEPTLKGYQFPEPLDRPFFDDIPEKISRNKDCFRVFKIGLSLYERAWAMRGMENLLIYMATNAAFVEDLLDCITEYYLALIDRSVQQDIDAFHFGDDWGSQRELIMGPRYWRKYIKPRMARMFARIRQAGKYVSLHSDGNITSIFPDLIEIGLDIYNPFQPEIMDVYALKKEYGDRLCFHGGIGVQELLPHATPQEVRAEVQRLIAEVGAGGGYILAPSHSILGDVPVENVVALLETVREQ